MAEVTEIIEGKVKVKFNQDDVPSVLEYPKLSSYKPIAGDKVLMLKTNTSFICIGGVGDEPSEVKENPYIVGEYKFFANDKGLMWKGWARCDGRTLSSSAYAELFTEIGTTFGGSGGNFNLPNTTGRVLSDASGETFGGSVGSKSATLSVANMPKHNHTMVDPGHTHNQYMGEVHASYPVNGTCVLSGTVNSKLWNPSGRSQIVSSKTGITLGETGSGSNFDIRQPTFYGGYYYIYTGGGIE